MGLFAEVIVIDALSTPKARKRRDPASGSATLPENMFQGLLCGFVRGGNSQLGGQSRHSEALEMEPLAAIIAQADETIEHAVPIHRPESSAQ
jgi:hypothetical protein